jgi:Permease MlaE
MIEGVVGLERLLRSVGELPASARRLVRHPRAGYWKDIPLLVERSGLDAVPVILVINFLVGFVMAYRASRSLVMFGANIYVAAAITFVHRFGSSLNLHAEIHTERKEDLPHGAILSPGRDQVDAPVVAPIQTAGCGARATGLRPSWMAGKMAELQANGSSISRASVSTA